MVRHRARPRPGPGPLWALAAGALGAALLSPGDPLALCAPVSRRGAGQHRQRQPGRRLPPPPPPPPARRQQRQWPAAVPAAGRDVAERRPGATGGEGTFSIEHASCFWVASTGAVEGATEVLRSCEVIAVDVEGDSLGHGGRAATIQLATPDTCYVVDLAALGMPDCLRELLQGKKPVKVCHGFASDQINLIEQFNLDFCEATLFDTQAALGHMSHSGGKSVVNVLEGFTAAPPNVLSEMLAMKKRLRWINFFQRPLPENVLRYACLDVVFLVSAFSMMTQDLSETDVADIVVKSKYCGPYGKGNCYRPPTMKQIARQKRKGKTWSDEAREWVMIP